MVDISWEIATRLKNYNKTMSSVIEIPLTKRYLSKILTKYMRNLLFLLKNSHVTEKYMMHKNVKTKLVYSA